MDHFSNNYHRTIFENGVKWEWDPYTSSYFDYSDYDRQNEEERVEKEKIRQYEHEQWVKDQIKIPFDKWFEREKRSKRAKELIESREEYRSAHLDMTFKEFIKHKYSKHNLIKKGFVEIFKDYRIYESNWRDLLKKD